ncbi:MAG: peptide ABC transporter [Dehalococcoidia bacterium SG8_51_3]|nr:MAG: peptide ABC transporter [Dehalococcoidia bacterium SG8_51_3]HEY96649.1 ABC transporter permease [Dehalococcoidia bacterium]
MTAYIIRRLIIAVVILIIVTLIVFFVMQLLPGDPLVIFLGQQAGTGSMSQEQLEQLYIRYGLDKPLIVQYWNWISGVVKGNMGESIYYHENVGKLLLERFPVTLDLGIKSFIIYNILGIVMGMVAALRRGKWLDTFATLLSYIGVSIPVFWLGLLLIYLFGLRLDWFPIAGYTLPTEDLWKNLHQSVLPVFCLSLMGWAVIARQTRSSVLEVMSQDYVRTAWSKGLTERKVIMRHILKNSLIPVITIMGIGLGLMFGGQVFIEQVFAIPGVGRLLVGSIFAQDYQVVQSATLVIATIVILINLIVDISYGWLDPRIRYG